MSSDSSSVQGSNPFFTSTSKVEDKKKSESPLGQKIQQNGEALSTASENGVNRRLRTKISAPPSERQDSPLSHDTKDSESLLIGRPFNVKHTYRGTLVSIPQNSDSSSSSSQEKDDIEIGRPTNVQHTSFAAMLSPEELAHILPNLERQKASRESLIPLSELNSSGSSSSCADSPENKGKEEEDSPKMKKEENLNEPFAHTSIEDLEQTRLHFWAMPRNEKRKDGLRGVHQVLLEKVSSRGANMSIDDLTKAYSIFSHMDNSQNDGLRAVYTALKEKVLFQGADISIEEIKKAEALFNALLTSKAKVGDKKDNSETIHFALKTKVFLEALGRLNKLAPTWPTPGPFREGGSIGRDSHAKTIKELTTKNIFNLMTGNKNHPFNIGSEVSEHLFITGLIKNPAFFDLA